MNEVELLREEIVKTLKVNEEILKELNQKNEKIAQLEKDVITLKNKLEEFKELI